MTDIIQLFAVVVVECTIFLRPKFGLWLLLFALPFQRIVPINLPIGLLTLPRAIILFTMVGLVIRKLIERSDNKKSFGTPFDCVLLVLLLAWLASSFMSIQIDPNTQIQVFLDPSRTHLARQQPFLKSYTEIISYLVTIGALYVMSGLLTTTKLTRSAITFWIMGAVIACLIGLYATLGYYLNFPIPENISNTYYLTTQGSDAEVSRIRSVASEPRYLSYYLITIFPFLVITSLYKKYVISRRFHLFAMGLIGLTFWLTMSRSMIILGFAMLVFLPLIVILIRSKSGQQKPVVSLRRIAFTLVVILSLAAVLLFAISGVNLGSAVLALSETINPEQGSVGPQLINNIMALNLFLENPVLGVGIGNYTFFAGPAAIPDWFLSDYGAGDSPVFITSVYLQTMCEVGIVGLIALFYLITTIISTIVRTAQMAKDTRSFAISVGLLSSFIMIVIAVLFIPNFFYPETWVVVGFIAVMSRHVASNQEMGMIIRPKMTGQTA